MLLAKHGIGVQYTKMATSALMDAASEPGVGFAADESGATAIEYGLIAAGISVAIITVVVSLGSKLNATFTVVANALVK